MFSRIRTVSTYAVATVVGGVIGWLARSAAAGLPLSLTKPPTQDDARLRELEAALYVARNEQAKAQVEVSTLRGDLKEIETRHQSLVKEHEALLAELQKVKQLPASTAPASAPIEPRKPSEPDDLTAIAGIGRVLASLLDKNGVRTFQQIARWTDKDIERMEGLLGSFRGRIRRDNWMASARRLHLEKYGQEP